MARTKKAGRKAAGGKAPRKQLAVRAAGKKQGAPHAHNLDRKIKPSQETDLFEEDGEENTGEPYTSVTHSPVEDTKDVKTEEKAEEKTDEKAEEKTEEEEP